MFWAHLYFAMLSTLCKDPVQHTPPAAGAWQTCVGVFLAQFRSYLHQVFLDAPCPPPHEQACISLLNFCFSLCNLCMVIVTSQLLC